MEADKLTRHIFMGLIAGVCLGLFGNFIVHSEYAVLQNIWQVINSTLVLIGKWFVSALKMIVVPLVFLSLVCGISHGNQKSLGRLSVWTFTLYIAMTICAISIALAVSNISQPGNGIHLGNADYQAPAAPSVMETLGSLIPSNPLVAMMEGNMLQIIIFALLFGLALKKYENDNHRLLALFSDLNGVILKLVNMIMAFAPIGVFALVTTVMAQQGIKIILPLANYFVTIIVVLMIQLFVVYSSMLKVFAKVSPRIFFSKIRSLSLFAFSTASSAATIPVTFKTVEDKLGVDRDVSSFTIPLGATVGMDGTAIMQGVAVVFIAGAYGVDLTILQLITVVLMATLAAVGTAPVPGAGMITLAMVLTQIGLPVEAIGIILGIDRLLDMLRTVINVVGDAVVSIIVAKKLNLFNEKIFNQKNE